MERGRRGREERKKERKNERKKEKNIWCGNTKCGTHGAASSLAETQGAVKP